MALDLSQVILIMTQNYRTRQAILTTNTAYLLNVAVVSARGVLILQSVPLKLRDIN